MIQSSEAHRRRFGSEYDVVTDPDLCFDRCPKDVLERLIEGLQRHPTVNKITAVSI
ncbi:MAG: hypothetical protein HUJ26_15505 [Planctomycetaceae bacterium]|nr:hypothetical protein [Planctomycetaceae bacterium]